MSSDGAQILQRTLDGGEQLLTDIEELRERPDTFRWCHECEEWILRSRFGPHEDHDYRAQREQLLADDGDDAEDETDEAERVGAWYDITLSFSVDYRFTVPAWNDKQAEEVAKEWAYDASPADRMHMHTRTDERSEIFEDDPDLPDDFDPYGSERLWEAFERAKEDESDE